jgi:NAD(P)-dependent dehydrogenase (short-subunit alcohol dehydrogenase family)
VNAIAPGFIDVGMNKGMPDEAAANFIKQIPPGRLGDAENIVDAYFSAHRWRATSPAPS